MKPHDSEAVTNNYDDEPDYGPMPWWAIVMYAVVAAFVGGCIGAWMLS